MDELEETLLARARAEEARHAGETCYRLILESMQEGCQIIGFDWRFLYVNDALVRQARLPRAQLLGRTIMECYPGIDQTPLFDVLRRCMEQRETRQLENRFTFPDGEQGWFDLRIHPIPEGIFIVSHDISSRKATEQELERYREHLEELIADRTAELERLNELLAVEVAEHRQAEQDIRESRERIFTLINASPDAICFKDGQGRWVEANRSILALFGLEQAPWRGRTDAELAELADPFFREALLSCRQSDEAAWQRGATVRSAEIVPQPNDAGREFDVLKVPLFEDDGGRRGLMVMARDLSELQRAEEELRESAARYHRLLQIAPIPLCWVNARGEITLFNDLLVELFGWTKKDLPTMEAMWLRVFPDPPQRDRAMAQWQQACRRQAREGGYILGGEYECACRDDGKRLVEVRGIAQEDGFLVTFLDLTLQRSLEAEGEALRDQLQQAQKLESVGRLAGGVAHDFNNKLSIILGYAELALRDYRPEPRMRRVLEEITTAGRHSAELTQQLLAFARRQVISPRVLDLNETIGGMLKMLKRLIGENIALHWVPAASSPRVLLDPVQLDQILANLTVNARDAIGGVGDITIEAASVQPDEAFRARHPDALPGEHVRLRVHDTGCGMDETLRQHIFEPFFTTKGVGEGTGLGLATVYGIVKQNHGVIEVDSAPGAGTTFTIHFPRHGDEPDLARRDGQDDDLPRGCETVLLVEDEDGVREMTCDLLELLGYTVLAAADPQKALALAREHRGHIDLLLSDVIMPGMHGRELARLLTAERPGLRVLYISGYAMETLAQHGMLETNLRLLQKPFSLLELAQRLRECLDHSS